MNTTPKASDPVELVPAVVDAGLVALTRATAAGETTGTPLRAPTAAQAAVTPTQVRRPWRSTVRTVWQAFLGLCVLAPILVEAAGLDPAKLPWLVVPLAVAAAVTRIMAVPAVETWLRRFLPFLAAAPAPRD